MLKGPNPNLEDFCSASQAEWNLHLVHNCLERKKEEIGEYFEFQDSEEFTGTPL